MFDTEQLYEEIDSIWPNRRNANDRQAEKVELNRVVKCEEDASSLKNKIEILISNKHPKKLPQLFRVITEFAKPSPVVVITNTIVQDTTDDNTFKDKEEAFLTILSKWPENEIKQSKEKARQAFYAATNKTSLDDLKRACLKYCVEMSNPQTASLHPVGIKRFLEDSDFFDKWLQKSLEAPDTYNKAFFESAYEHYPKFYGKGDALVKADSLSFYKRFIGLDDAIDFWCAVKAYASDRRTEIRDKGEDDGEKFTKRFHSFIRVWKQQKRHEYSADLVIFCLVKVLNKTNIPYRQVYSGDQLDGAVKYMCMQVNENNEEAKFCTVVGNLLSYIFSSLGSSYTPVTAVTNLVTQVMSIAYEEVAKMPLRIVAL